MPKQHPLLQDCLKRLQEIQTELESMEVLPPAGSQEAVAMYGQWMIQMERMRELRQEAKNTALWVVPGQVQRAIDRIYGIEEELYPGPNAEKHKP